MIDKFYEVVAPKKALERAVARKQLKIVNSGYSHHGASRVKKSLLGWISTSRSTKEDIDDNQALLRERSRDLYMGAPIATSALKTMRTNVVGAGLKLNPQLDHKFLKITEDEAEAWEENVEREFSLWADSIHCDAQRMNNFYELQQLAFLNWMMNGECFGLLPYVKRVNMPYDLRIQLIEADRVCNPVKTDQTKEVINGIEIGKHGEVIAYYVCNQHPGSLQSPKKEWVRINKFGKKTGRPNILHLMESERCEQRRGIPILAPVIESLKQLARYTEAELMAAVVSGMFTVFIESQDQSEDNPFGEMVPSQYEVDSEDENSYEMGNGAIIALGEGEKANVANPGRPNAQFDPFVTSICRQIGSALEIPYELLIKHFTASYSASRAALLEAWKMFRMRRTWMANDFCQPIYEEWLAEAIAKGRIAAPGFFNDPMIRKAYSTAEWNGPSQGQIDPLKEVNAAEKRVNNGFSTRAKETTELTGGDFKRNYRQRVREEKMMLEIHQIGGENNDKN